MPPLGSNQVDFLLSLLKHPRWYRNCGWVWKGERETIKLMEQMLARGYVSKTEERPRHPLYVLTPEGRAEANRIKEQQRYEWEAQNPGMLPKPRYVGSSTY